MWGARKFLGAAFVVALCSMSVIGQTFADEMASSEIFRRMELQLSDKETGPITRGLRLSYGEKSESEAASTLGAPLDSPSYQVVREEARIDLHIYFEWNSAALKPQALSQLSALCDAMKRVPPSQAFRIIGHTDKSGDQAYNLYLSRARAKEVKRHLVQDCIISDRSLLAIGEGERYADPAAPERNPTERRVEVQLVS